MRKVKDSGRIKWGGVVLHLTDALTGEYVGLAPMAEEGWREMRFGPLLLAYLDESRLRIIPAKGVNQ